MDILKIGLGKACSLLFTGTLTEGFCLCYSNNLTDL